MKVSLIDYTGFGSPDPARHAAELLVFTKNTRLKMDPDTMKSVRLMPAFELMEQLEYMARTIPSSWEFVNYTFLITGVTRAFTHQFVRTRTGSYAQQTMRVLDVTGFTYERGPTIEGNQGALEIYDDTMATIQQAYRELIALGANIEDARGVLPTNIHTNIVAHFNMRTLAEMVTKRSSSRTQGEYREVLDAMKAAVVEVHPWAPLFFNRDINVAAKELEERILYNIPEGELRTRMIKLIDELRKQ
jgi:thymidylate synthase (FAD)